MTLAWWTAPRRLALARATFLLIAVTGLALLALQTPIRRLTIWTEWVCQESDPAEASYLSRAAYARYILGRDYAVALLCAFTGLFIGWRKADDRAAWLAGALLVTLPLALSGYDGDWLYYPWPWRRLFAQTSEALSLLSLNAMALFILLFPSGRPARGWLGWFFGLAFAVEAGLTVWNLQTDGGAVWTAWILTWLILLPIGVGALAYRYRRLSTPVERQQIKWVVVGLSAMVILLINAFLVVTLLAATPLAALAQFVTDHALRLAVALLPLSLAVSILRYRLWDIDLLIRRTLLYTTLTGALAILYLGSVIVLQGGLRALTGQAQSPLVTVFSTLVIAAAAGPLRTRVQRGIDRRFNRRRYDAARTLEAYGAALRADADADLDQLNTQLMRVVQDTLEPKSVSLWLRRDP